MHWSAGWLNTQVWVAAKDGFLKSRASRDRTFFGECIHRKRNVRIQFRYDVRRVSFANYYNSECTEWNVFKKTRFLSITLPSGTASFS